MDKETNTNLPKDIEFGDPDLMRKEFDGFIKMSPAQAEGKLCEMAMFGAKYILPSGRVIHLTMGHVRNTYKLGFKSVYPATPPGTRGDTRHAGLYQEQCLRLLRSAGHLLQSRP